MEELESHCGKKDMSVTSLDRSMLYSTLPVSSSLSSPFTLRDLDGLDPMRHFSDANLRLNDRSMLLICKPRRRISSMYLVFREVTVKSD